MLDILELMGLRMEHYHRERTKHVAVFSSSSLLRCKYLLYGVVRLLAVFAHYLRCFGGVSRCFALIVAFSLLGDSRESLNDIKLRSVRSLYQVHDFITSAKADGVDDTNLRRARR